VRTSDATRIVREGYDHLGDAYRDWAERMMGGYRASFLEDVLRRIAPGSDVLEVGCGPGTDALALSDRRRYTGIDLSRVQLDQARRVVPGGTLIHADVLEIAFRPASFDAVVALYVFNHIPHDELGGLFRRIWSWLRPGGWFCASFGTSAIPGAVEPAWLGTSDMYFSSLPPERTEALLVAAGFSLWSRKTVTEVEEGEGPATFRWVIARRSLEGPEDA
jgi:SAM-dependent methyltransferase